MGLTIMKILIKNNQKFNSSNIIAKLNPTPREKVCNS